MLLPHDTPAHRPLSATADSGHGCVRLRRWQSGSELARGWSSGARSGPPLPAAERRGPNWRMYDYVRYTDALPHCTAVIHHAGAGVTYHALAASLAAVVVPQNYDQFDYAARLHHHGAALRGNVRLVPALLRRVLTEPTCRKRAREFSTCITRHNLPMELRALLATPAPFDAWLRSRHKLRAQNYPPPMPPGASDT